MVMRTYSLFILILLTVSLQAQRRVDSLLLFARLYGVSEFVEGNRIVSKRIVSELRDYYLNNEAVDLNSLVDQLLPNDPKSNYKILDTADLLVINDHEKLLNSPILSETSRSKLRFAVLGKNESMKKIIKDVNVIDYEDVMDKSLDQDKILESLLRVWNGIEYFYPYKYKLTIDWDDEFLQQLKVFASDSIMDQRDYRRAIKNMVYKINDGHIDLIRHFTDKEYRKSDKLHKKLEKKEEDHEHEDEVFGKFYPIHVYMINGNLYVTKIGDFKHLEGLEVGDKVLSINGLSPQQMEDSLFSIVPSSRPELIEDERNAANSWLYFNGDDYLMLEVEGKDTVIKVDRVEITDQEFNDFMGYEYVKSVDVNDAYAYIRIWERDKKTFRSEIKRSAKEDIPLIIDLRGYPSKMFVAMSAKYFSSKPKDIADFYVPLKNYPGFYKKIEKMPYFFTNKVDLVLKASRILPQMSNIFYPLTKKVDSEVVLLINEENASWGETMTLIFKEYPNNVTLIGRNTNGTNGNVGALLLPGKMELLFTHYRIDNEDGSNFQHIGVQPDIYVKKEIPTKENPNPDPILSTALNYLFNKKAVQNDEKRMSKKDPSNN